MSYPAPVTGQLIIRKATATDGTHEHRRDRLPRPQSLRCAWTARGCNQPTRRAAGPTRGFRPNPGGTSYRDVGLFGGYRGIPGSLGAL